ncbi:MSHA biogenesis protein MshJ [Shewanella sp. D64]|uniref:MSHA biogenesis protein MshJ n=1 Tax=unclassified Shewanella TaxID=196818 RepID=UPI0022BA6C49|nr:MULTISPECIES: MSHA biogenesis protein MshJ [unclassified Shewanella]MEC4725438.1 MSHA biogenesis protein MshJ [Shewanella sp. D64]MEC4738745.1 MSHA biogenesis protein MshJ [Shewanella sp. E94]WBJ95037.1 MSHA biogenesis protein MshJ [Shewanella sp. MTB7]
MKQKLQELGAHFDLLSQRERVMVAVAAFVVIGMLCYLPVESLLLKHNKLSRNNLALVAENKVSLQQIELYKQRLEQDPNDEYHARFTVLEQQSKELDKQLSFQMVDMVPADHMATLLSQLLETVKGIELQDFQSIAPIPLLAIGEEKKMNLYSHGIRLTFQGDYFAVLKFIQAIEAMPNKLYWKRMEYQVEEYPVANIILELYTLSINKDFISVSSQG